MVAIPMKEVARRANVSCSAVSHILNHREGFVSKETRERILEIIKETGYRPHSIARSLKLKKTYTIGLVTTRLRVPVNIVQLDAIRHAARKAGYHLILGYSEGEIEEEKVCLDELRFKHVDGIIVSTTGMVKNKNEHIKELVEEGLPVVAIDPVTNVEIDFVTVDRKYGASLATEHLIKLGHQRIAFLSGSLSYYSTVQKLLGYEEALGKYGLKLNNDLLFTSSEYFPGHLSYSFGYRMAGVILEEKKMPSAILCINDEVAIGALRRLREVGIKVPGDVALIGYDNEEGASFSEVPLTTVDQPMAEVGATVFRILLDKIKRHKRKELHYVFLKPELVIRKSCGGEKG